MSYQVFISYSSRDKVFADALCAKLEGSGLRCWIAPRDIPAGSEWGASILSGIEKCKLLALIFTENSDSSPQVIREVERAVSKRLIIVPIRIHNIMPRDSMEYFLSAVHWLDAITPPFERHLEKIVGRITRILRESQTSRHIHETPPISSASFSSGDYLHRGELSAPDGAQPIEIVQDYFDKAPFLLTFDGEFLGWMEGVLNSDNSWVYQLRSSSTFFEAERNLSIAYMAFSKGTFKFNSPIEIRAKAITQEFGGKARHADFEDVKRAAAMIGSALFIDLLDLRKIRNPEIAAYDGVDYWNQGPFVTYKGKTSEGSRAYFISVHDGILVDDWRIIETIDLHNIDLGSWHNNRKLLVYIEQQFLAKQSSNVLELRPL